jgi:hypothetical protein
MKLLPSNRTSDGMYRVPIAAIVVLVLISMTSLARAEQDSVPAPEDLAVLKSELAYCQITTFDGRSRPLIEDRWALVAGPHVLHFECNAVFGSPYGAENRPIRSEVVIIDDIGNPRATRGPGQNARCSS